MPLSPSRPREQRLVMMMMASGQFMPCLHSALTLRAGVGLRCSAQCQPWTSPAAVSSLLSCIVESLSCFLSGSPFVLRVSTL